MCALRHREIGMFLEGPAAVIAGDDRAEAVEDDGRSVGGDQFASEVDVV